MGKEGGLVADNSGANLEWVGWQTVCFDGTSEAVVSETARRREPQWEMLADRAEMFGAGTEVDRFTKRKRPVAGEDGR